MDQPTVQRTFEAALETLIEQIRHDRSILAAVLCGSLSHDRVWAKSDIDLVLVTIDDQKVEPRDVALYADGVNVHALLMPRTEFRKTTEGSVGNSFVHSFLAQGRLLYTHEPTIAELCARLHQMGDRDRQLQLLRAATSALPAMDKARKWLVTRGDLEYATLWLLIAAPSLAKLEVIGRGLLAGREVIPQAMLLNHAFFSVIYADLLNTEKTRERVEHALDAADQYIGERALTVFGPILDHLREVGEARACSEIETYFTRNFDVSGVTIACEYLADRGLIGKASLPVRLTKKSNVQVQELAFFHLGA